MSNHLVKICGVKSATIAAQAAKLGAHFIGIVFHPTSKRFVKIECAKEIAKITKENNAIPVAVFVNHTAEQMHEICQKTGIQTVQLHGDIARKEHDLLPQHYERIYVQSVLPNGRFYSNNHDTLQQCNPLRDYLLFDNINAGSGTIFDWQALPSHAFFRTGLAGGLTNQNISAAIKIVKPHFVDVSSGVENNQGEKDILLIKKFIDTVLNLNAR